MNKTAREGVKRGKNRAAHKKKKVAPEGMTRDDVHNSGAGQKPSKASRSVSDTLGKEQNGMRVKVANGRLPPLVPPTKVLLQKSNDIELHDRGHDGGGKRKRKVGSEEAALESLSVVKDKEAPRTPSPATRRRNENMTSYERMLQREKRQSRKISGSYTILQSEPEEEVELSYENPSGSSTSLRSRASSRKDPNQALLQYFAKLSSSPDVEDSLDLEHIQSLLHEGASVNSSDRFGQTLLHEVSRSWGVDVAQFFIEQGKRSDEQLLKPQDFNPDETRD